MRTRGSDRYSSQFENNYFTAMCSGSEAGSYLRLIDFVYHSTLGLRVKKKKRGSERGSYRALHELLGEELEERVDRVRHHLRPKGRPRVKKDDRQDSNSTTYAPHRQNPSTSQHPANTARVPRGHSGDNIRANGTSQKWTPP